MACELWPAYVLAAIFDLVCDLDSSSVKIYSLNNKNALKFCCYPGVIIIQWKCPDRWMNVWKWKCENWLNRMLLNYEMINNPKHTTLCVYYYTKSWQIHISPPKKHSTHPTTQKKRTQELFYYTRFVHKVEPNDRSFVSSYK